MAKNTDLALKQSVIYQVYNRNHNESGTFRELIEDLPRIKSLGVDIVYLLPIHPIGKKDKKGELGCPYSISDYRLINPEYGTLGDFLALIKETHKLGMKLMIDVVYNHTSRDSYLLNHFPEWFYKNDKGEFANRVGDWSDITDFDYSQDASLWDELIDILKYWASLGVDGYRCDVASFVPIEFWIKARTEIAKINPHFIWLAETVDKEFIQTIRSLGFLVHSDCEIYQAFDICYDYDVYHSFKSYLIGKTPLEQYIGQLQEQEVIYPGNYIKLRCLENHDQDRIASLVQTVEQLKLWTSFVYLQKGTTMIYAGQEAVCKHTPSLFDVDKVDWSAYNENGIADLMRKLAQLKKDKIMRDGFYTIEMGDISESVILKYESQLKKRVAIFNFGIKAGEVDIDILDGSYVNLLTGSPIVVNNGKIQLGVDPILIDVDK